MKLNIIEYSRVHMWGGVRDAASSIYGICFTKVFNVVLSWCWHLNHFFNLHLLLCSAPAVSLEGSVCNLLCHCTIIPSLWKLFLTESSNLGSRPLQQQCRVTALTPTQERSRVSTCAQLCMWEVELGGSEIKPSKSPADWFRSSYALAVLGMNIFCSKSWYLKLNRVRPPV